MSTSSVSGGLSVLGFRSRFFSCHTAMKGTMKQQPGVSRNYNKSLRRAWFQRPATSSQMCGMSTRATRAPREISPHFATTTTCGMMTGRRPDDQCLSSFRCSATTMAENAVAAEKQGGTSSSNVEPPTVWIAPLDFKFIRDNVQDVAGKRTRVTL